MSYTYLGLVNKVLERFNEVPLTSSSFASAGGFYASVKQYINNAIDEINIACYMWPWNYVSYDETLVAGTSRYAYQTNTKIVDFDTFRIRKNDTFGNETVRLTPINYDEYVRRFIDAEYDSDTSSRDLPRYVFKTQNRGYGIYPPPDNAYTLTYEYFSNPAPLINATDVPTLPEDFCYAIVDGASAYAYRFRGDLETSRDLQSKFEKNIDDLRRLYIPMEDDLTDTRVLYRGYSNTIRI